MKGDHATEQAVGTFLDHASDPVKGFVRVGIAAALAAVMTGVASLLNRGFELEIATSSARGLVQILAAGAVIGVLLAAHLAQAGVGPMTIAMLLRNTAKAAGMQESVSVELP